MRRIVLSLLFALGVSSIVSACSDVGPVAPDFVAPRRAIACGGEDLMMAPVDSPAGTGTLGIPSTISGVGTAGNLGGVALSSMECCGGGTQNLSSAAGGLGDASAALSYLAGCYNDHCPDIEYLAEWCNGEWCRDGEWIGDLSCDPNDCRNLTGGCIDEGGGGGTTTSVRPVIVASCSGPVIRRQEVTCTAYVVDSATNARLPFQMEEQRATVSLGVGVHERIDDMLPFYSASQQHEWRGRAVAETSVEFTATASGVSVSTVVGFSVSPRMLSAMTIATVREYTIYFPPLMPNPPVLGSAMGVHSADNHNAFNSIAVDEVEEGPNGGLSMLHSLPALESEIAISPALYPGSPFYAAQTGGSRCSQAQTDAFRAEVRRHEGVGSAVNSHVGVANQSLQDDQPHVELEATTVAGDPATLRVMLKQAWFTYVESTLIPKQQAV